MFISSSLHLEVKLLSGLLEKMSEDYPESFQKILDQAKVLLEEMPNYYVSQALLGSEDTILFLPTKKKLIKKEK